MHCASPKLGATAITGHNLRPHNHRCRRNHRCTTSTSSTTPCCHCTPYLSSSSRSHRCTHKCTLHLIHPHSHHSKLTHSLCLNHPLSHHSHSRTHKCRLHVSRPHSHHSRMLSHPTHPCPPSQQQQPCKHLVAAAAAAAAPQADGRGPRSGEDHPRRGRAQQGSAAGRCAVWLLRDCCPVRQDRAAQQPDHCPDRACCGPAV
mmetsp:Transcript_16538/g.45363  ORF Transcript_16538/g.45363 Transcript_16538/m.45363 type:complete len:202 (-) Transcript_16538:842-1447(-)